MILPPLIPSLSVPTLTRLVAPTWGGPLPRQAASPELLRSTNSFRIHSRPTPNHVLSQSPVTACHSNLSQLVIVAAGSILWGPWDRCRSRGPGPFQPTV